jgi:hypothetical protein
MPPWNTPPGRFVVFAALTSLVVTALQ